MKVTCPQGHRLLVVREKRSWECNECKGRKPKDQPHRCEICDYDICMKCFNRKSKALKEAGSDADADPKRKKEVAGEGADTDEEMLSMRITNRTIERIKNLLFVHSPRSGFPQSKKLLAQFSGREEALLDSLLRKYQAEGEPAYQDTILARVESVLRYQFGPQSGSSRVAWIRSQWRAEWEGKEAALWSSILRGSMNEEPIPTDDLVAAAKATVVISSSTTGLEDGGAKNHDLDGQETHHPSPKSKIVSFKTPPPTVAQLQHELVVQRVVSQIHDCTPKVPRPSSIDDGAELQFFGQLGWAACSGDPERLMQQLGKFNAKERGLPVG